MRLWDGNIHGIMVTMHASFFLLLPLACHCCKPQKRVLRHRFLGDDLLECEHASPYFVLHLLVCSNAGVLSELHGSQVIYWTSASRAGVCLLPADTVRSAHCR